MFTGGVWVMSSDQMQCVQALISASTVRPWCRVGWMFCAVTQHSPGHFPISISHGNAWLGPGIQLRALEVYPAQCYTSRKLAPTVQASVGVLCKERYNDRCNRSSTVRVQ